MVLVAAQPLARNVDAARDLWTRPSAVVANSDLDGLLSAAYVCSTFGHSFAGFCNPNGLWLRHGIRLTDPLLFLENDVTHPRFRAIGQHYMPSPTYRRAEHLNVNWAAEITRYTSKYPLALIHFILWATSVPASSLGRIGTDIVLLADSTWACAIDYARNMSDWLTTRMPESDLRRRLLEIVHDPDAYQRTVVDSLFNPLGLDPLVKTKKGARRITQQFAMPGRRLSEWLPTAVSTLAFIDRHFGWKLTIPGDPESYRVVLALKRHSVSPSLLDRLPRPFSAALPFAQYGNVSYVDAIGVADQSDAQALGLVLQ